MSLTDSLSELVFGDEAEKEEHRYMIVPAVFLLLIKDNQVLLLRRANTGHMDGQYGLPSGHIEAGEMPTTAAVRELAEEVGIDITPQDIVPVHTMYASGDPTYVNLFFNAKAWTGEPEVKEPDRADHVAWFPLDALPENTIPYVRWAIKAHQEGKHYSELGSDYNAY